MIWPRARFRTDRLILRPYRRRDAARLPIYLDDWDTARWLSRTPFPYSLQDAHDWIRMSRRILRRGEGYPLAITARSDKVLMGGIGLSLQTGEVGYWLGSQWRGKQFVSEALGKIIEIAFQQQPLKPGSATINLGDALKMMKDELNDPPKKD